jgi:hypothetical protein
MLVMRQERQEARLRKYHYLSQIQSIILYPILSNVFFIQCRPARLTQN